jgi:AbrB family looped-hinge helix DNA binding protein
VGKTVMARTVVDEKGRIVVPKALRNELRINEGSRVSVQIENERLVISRAVEPDEFIREMEGFVQRGRSCLWLTLFLSSISGRKLDCLR